MADFDVEQWLQSPVVTLPRYYPALDFAATYKSQPEDFCVSEQIGQDFSGDGEHLWLRVRKRLLTTNAVIEKLSVLTGCHRRNIGYAGLKDKYGVTEQWFSMLLTGLDAERIASVLGHPTVEQDGWEVLAQHRHQKKCRIGLHAGNAFMLVLRATENPSVEVKRQLEVRLEQIAAKGFPNYFTEQRFGHDNLSKLLKFSPKSRRKILPILLSAGRSVVFNALAASVFERVEAAVVGDICLLSGSRSFFEVTKDDLEKTLSRLVSGDVSLAMPMVGKDRWLPYREKLLALDVDADYRDVLCEIGDKVSKLADKAQYRSVFVKPIDLQWMWQDDAVLSLSFALECGSYATALLRELGQLREAVHANAA